MGTFDMGLIATAWKADTAMSASPYYCVTGASTAATVKIATGGSDPTPLGVYQGEGGCVAGDAVDVVLFGPTKAEVVAATTAGTACDIDIGHKLVVGTDGKLYYSGSGLYNAVSLEILDSGSARINVFWLGPGGASMDAAY